MTAAISLVIPVLDEAAIIGDCLAPLQRWRAEGMEVVVADGGSRDGTPLLAAGLCDRLVTSPRGRARQMNAGAAAAGGELLLFLHADTRLPETVDFTAVRRRLEAGSGWGFCAVTLSGRRRSLRVIEWFMNRRSRLTGIGTGDQLLMVGRRLFAGVGGFPDIPLMEDIAMSRALKRHAGWPVNPGITVTTSSRRWEEQGVAATVLLMWKLRLFYLLGADPAALRRRYYR